MLLLPFLKPGFERWGATEEEHLIKLPGDDLVNGVNPAGYTHAITINAPASRIWPWLVQIGQDKGGYYSYELLENIAGCKIKNADRIIPEFQTLAVGDKVLMHPEAGYPYIVAAIEPYRALVLHITMNTRSNEPFDTTEGFPEKFLNQSWAFVLEESDDGTTRLISRSRNEWNRSFGTNLGFRFIGSIAIIMDRRMLLGIKQRAETPLNTNL